MKIRGHKQGHHLRISPIEFPQDSYFWSCNFRQNQLLSCDSQLSVSSATDRIYPNKPRNTYSSDRYKSPKNVAWKSYICDYNHGGEKWSFYIKARSWEEAERMLRSIKGNAWVEGELHLKIPANNTGWLARAITWLANFVRRTTC